MDKLSGQYQDNVAVLDALLAPQRSFDMIARDLVISERRARLWFIDGYGEDAVIERVIASLLVPPQLPPFDTVPSFVERCLTFGEVTVERDITAITTSVFLGKTFLLLEGFDEGVLFDAKSFPERSVSEPSTGRVLRGSHDGFVEALVLNAALLRRRIRDPHFIMEGFKISTSSRADTALCYIEGKADPALVETMRRKLNAIRIGSVSMSQESIAEAIMPHQWYNPFPKVRYTERPDVSTACLMEGSIILLVDNTPAAMILPTSFFDFLEDANDYYFPPLVGTYMRLVRALVFALALFITPLWYLLIKDPIADGAWYGFLAVEEPNGVPILVQLFLLEFVVDLLKLASLNTPEVLSNSFSMLGALILGDFAVKANWLVPEVLAYMAFVAIANFAQPSYELGYAFKLMRMFFLILCALFDWWGLAGGVLIMLVLLATTRPVLGKHYLYPLYPFRPSKLFLLLLRRPISRKNS